MKRALKSFLNRAGLRVSRTGAFNRFDAHRDVFEHLRNLGFRPNLLVDGGANVGNWTRLVRGFFPDAEFHLVEPQPNLQAALTESIAGCPKSFIHPVALAEPGVDFVTLSGSGTGSFVSPEDSNQGVRVPARTLDALFADLPAAREKVFLKLDTLDALFADLPAAQEKVFLKLDLEGYEIPALRGGTRLLSRCDFVLLESHFYNFDGLNPRTFLTLANQMESLGFQIYDFASDGRLRMCDVLFHREGNPLTGDLRWD
jgi:FkbM family methyltransferase